MVYITSIALGVSVITTGILTLHDTLRKADHVKGFMRFLLGQNMQTSAQYALTCVAAAVEERVTTKGEQLKSKITNSSSDIISQTFEKLQNSVQNTLKNINAESLINYLKEQQKQIEKQEKKQIDNQNKDLKNVIDIGEKKNQQVKGFWQTITYYKNAINEEINKQFQQYKSLRSKKQQKTLQYLYQIFKQEKGIYNDKFITPYNFVMLIVLGIGSFFLPKLTIMLGISYFISAELYLLSDTITKATKTQRLKNLKFQNILQFHIAIFCAAFSFNQYNVYRQKKTSLADPRYKYHSSSF